MASQQQLNTVIMQGNVGRDMEVRTTPNGTIVGDFTLAHTYGVRQADGTWNNQTVWARITVWGENAPRIAEKVKKGARVTVQGRLRAASAWLHQENPVGQTEIVADNVVVHNGSASTNSELIEDSNPFSEDDLPF